MLALSGSLEGLQALIEVDGLCPVFVGGRWLRFWRGDDSSEAEVAITGSSSFATSPLQHPFPGTDSTFGLTMLAAASILECSSTIVTFCSHCFSFGVAGQSLSSTLLSWPSSWEKLDQKLVRLVTTLIKQVVAGPVGGGRGGGGGVGSAVAVAVQRAPAREAWWAAARILERSIAFGPQRRGRRQRPPVAPGWPAGPEHGESLAGDAEVAVIHLEVDLAGSRQDQWGRSRSVFPIRIQIGPQLQHSPLFSFARLCASLLSRSDKNWQRAGLTQLYSCVGIGNNSQSLVLVARTSNA